MMNYDSMGNITEKILNQIFLLDRVDDSVHSQQASSGIVSSVNDFVIDEQNENLIEYQVMLNQILTNYFVWLHWLTGILLLSVCFFCGYLSGVFSYRYFLAFQPKDRFFVLQHRVSPSNQLPRDDSAKQQQQKRKQDGDYISPPPSYLSEADMAYTEDEEDHFEPKIDANEGGQGQRVQNIFDSFHRMV